MIGACGFILYGSRQQAREGEPMRNIYGALCGYIFGMLVMFFGIWITSGGQAFAQATGDPSGLGVFGLDDVTLTLLGKSAPLLGTLLFGAVASLKRYVEQQGTRYTWSPIVWRAIALGSGILGAVVLHLSGYGAEMNVLHAQGWAAVAAFGLFAGFVAMFGRDVFKTLAQQRGAAVGAGIAAALPVAPALLYRTTTTSDGGLTHSVTEPVLPDSGPLLSNARALLASKAAGSVSGLPYVPPVFLPDGSPTFLTSAQPEADILPPEGLIQPSPALAATLAQPEPSDAPTGLAGSSTGQG